MPESSQDDQSSPKVGYFLGSFILPCFVLPRGSFILPPGGSRAAGTRKAWSLEKYLALRREQQSREKRGRNDAGSSKLIRDDKPDDSPPPKMGKFPKM